MYNFNDEEKALFEIYKGNTPEETLKNIRDNMNEASEEIREKLIKIKMHIENGN